MPPAALEMPIVWAAGIANILFLSCVLEFPQFCLNNQAAFFCLLCNDYGSEEMLVFVPEVSLFLILPYKKKESKISQI